MIHGKAHSRRIRVLNIVGRCALGSYIGGTVFFAAFMAYLFIDRTE